MIVHTTTRGEEESLPGVTVAAAEEEEARRAKGTKAAGIAAGAVEVEVEVVWTIT